MDERKAAARLRKHGLDLDHMSYRDIKSANANDIRDMDLSTAGSGMYSLGQLLMGNSDISMIIDLMKAQIRQQWIIVRQNEQIIRLLSDDEYELDDTSGIPDEPDTDEMELVRRIPFDAREGAEQFIGQEIKVSDTSVLIDNDIIGTINPRMRDILIESKGRNGVAVLAKVNGKSGTIDVYA